MSVCIVDDNPLTLHKLKLVLSQAGVQHPRVFQEPIEALHWCSLYPPKLLLLDYNMPGLNGLEFMSQLRRSPAGRLIPVVFVSSWAAGTFREKALNAGAFDVVEKPFTTATMTDKLRALLQPIAQPIEVPATAWHDTQPQDVPTQAELEGPDSAVIRMLERLAMIRSDRSLRSQVLVARLAATIGGAHGVSLYDQELLLRATPFHDLGVWASGQGAASRPLAQPADSGMALDKALLSGHVLFKDCTSPVLRMAAEIAVSYQEHWDGSGQPFGLAADDIPLPGRIVAVAETFECMFSLPHNLGLKPLERADRVIEADCGSRFDPQVVAALHRARPSVLAILQHQH